MREDERFASIMKSATCLMTIAEAGNSDDISLLVDFISGFRVKQNYLFVIMSSFNETSFVNKTTTYNVLIIDRGINSLSDELSYIFWHPTFNTDGAWVRSLCPALGAKYATIHNGSCPLHLQQPHQKELPISFIGLPPYIKYSPFGGSDPHIIGIMAKKFGFKPKYVPAKSVDQGMVHQVNNNLSFHCLKLTCINFSNRWLWNKLK